MNEAELELLATSAKEAKPLEEDFDSEDSHAEKEH
jgi:hypothetical protein